MPKSILMSSATTLAERIRKTELSSLDVVNTHIRAIERVNPVINAMVANRFADARAEARRADEVVAGTPAAEREGLPALHGVPCTIKEAFSLTGMPNSTGLVARQHIRAKTDATAVQRIRTAGAIPLGVTNISELCMWYESYNQVYGRCCNPYDTGRTAGGSSGGEGAIVGSGASPFGLGSDVGGSIRMPAFFNGVFGHKSSGGLIPNTGQYPNSEAGAKRYNVTGPITRRASDLWPLIQLMAGPDGHDTGVIDYDLGDPATVDIKDLTVHVVREHHRLKIDRNLVAALDRAAESLRAMGARVVELSIPEFRYSFLIWGAMLSTGDQTPFGVLLGNGKPVASFRELVKWAFRRSDHTLPAIGLALLNDLPIGGIEGRFIEMGHALRQRLIGRLGPTGVILHPPHPRPAPRHNYPILRPLDFVPTGIFNVLEFAVTQVPMGLNAKHLPLGVQVVGTPGNDHTTVAVAQALEKAHGGWVPPRMFHDRVTA